MRNKEEGIKVLFSAFATRDCLQNLLFDTFFPFLPICPPLQSLLPTRSIKSWNFA
jgi:hypothetical protein